MGHIRSAMKKPWLIVLLVFLAVAALFAASHLRTERKSSTRTSDSASRSSTECGHDVIIAVPQPDQLVSSPLTVRGQAQGSWFFEGRARLALLDDRENEIASGSARAIGDWQTSELVDFDGEITFSVESPGAGTLLFENDNPSGLPEQRRACRIPVRFSGTAMKSVKVYFGNRAQNPTAECEQVFPMEREIPSTQAPARAALQALLAGPTPAEESAGYFSSLNAGVSVQRLTIEDGVARVDFDERIQEQVGGSCRVMAIRAQIEATLRQFPTVRRVIISVNGRSEDVLQP